MLGDFMFWGCCNTKALVERLELTREIYFRETIKKDKGVIDWAMEVTNTSTFQYQVVDTLSGGQRQRVWIAMALAQETNVIFLDEPTTYLDMAHQLEILELLDRLNKEQERTIIMVLHDLNQAAR